MKETSKAFCAIILWERKDISLKEGMWRNENSAAFLLLYVVVAVLFAAAIADDTLWWLRARAAAGGAGALWSGRPCALWIRSWRNMWQG